MMNLANNFADIDYHLKSSESAVTVDNGGGTGQFSIPTTINGGGDAVARTFFSEQQQQNLDLSAAVDRFDSPNLSSDHLSSGISLGLPLPLPLPGVSEVHQASERMPDADALKMFIGQIPKDWTETECRQLLEPYGPIYALNILKDKDSKKSKGCCFVTYYTRKAALDAQNDLHNLKKLPSCRNPIQMKPADNENKNDRKLFIGKLPKFMTETDVSSVFANYGIVEECIVLRDSNNQSKGCAFVTFSSRSSATSAIRALHQTKTLEGCTTPIVVKFAEAGSKQSGGEQGGKRLKNGSSLSISSSSSAAAAFSPLSSLQAAAFITGAGGAGTGSPLLDSSSYLNLIKAHQVQQQQQAQQQQHQQQLMSLAALQSAQSPYGSLASAEAAMAAVYGGGGGLLSSLGGGAGKTGISALAAASPLHQQLFAGTGASPKLLGESALPLSSFAGLSTLGHHPHHTLPHSAYASALTGPALAKLAAVSAAAASSTSSASRQVEGPEGANLFIYHLPAEYTDVDLVSLFAPYGNVISAKVFIDKNSNLSKCFGFVSYDNADSAQAAIRAMNGFQVLNKRLKVQLKKVRDRPY